MLTIEEMGKLYYGPLKKNRLVDDSGGTEKYKRIEDLQWNETELAAGKTIKINKRTDGAFKNSLGIDIYDFFSRRFFRSVTSINTCK